MIVTGYAIKSEIIRWVSRQSKSITVYSHAVSGKMFQVSIETEGVITSTATTATTCTSAEVISFHRK